MTLPRFIGSCSDLSNVHCDGCNSTAKPNTAAVDSHRLRRTWARGPGSYDGLSDAVIHDLVEVRLRWWTLKSRLSLEAPLGLEPDATDASSPQIHALSLSPASDAPSIDSPECRNAR